MNQPDTCHPSANLEKIDTLLRVSLRILFALLLCIWWWLTSLPSLAQINTPVSASSTAKMLPVSKPVSGLTLPTTFAGLDWKALTPAQQLALKPLAGKWTDLSDPQRRKWISLSANFALMTPGDQAKLHTRMAQWATLSPKEREQARLNFAEVQKIAPEQKTEKWQTYQALPPEEKQKLAITTRPKPPSTALAAKPEPPGKLNQVPLKNTTGGLGISVSAAAMPTIIVQPAIRPRASAPQSAASAPNLAASAPNLAASAPNPAASAPQPAASNDTPKP